MMDSMEDDSLFTEVVTTTEVPVYVIVRLLVTAFEGGSNYWYCNLEPLGSTEGMEFWHAEAPLTEEGVRFSDGEDCATYTLRRGECIKGIRIMAKKYPHLFANVMSGDYDVNEADAFLQCAVFGEVIYG